ncbi:hypothetical protein Ahy_B09g094859 isoform A [Arachis hypogaea]|uniref:Uncharacterized protein n=1 Tax=Arachis hypogaea TaxID=3818 RepID=A0A444XC99_ARAHY|nr:hypothetical protein Ahy_B09g094859 isoform A [Arachis hypogaea]
MEREDRFMQVLVLTSYSLHIQQFCLPTINKCTQEGKQRPGRTEISTPCFSQKSSPSTRLLDILSIIYQGIQERKETTTFEAVAKVWTHLVRNQVSKKVRRDIVVYPQRKCQFSTKPSRGRNEEEEEEEASDFHRFGLGYSVQSLFEVNSPSQHLVFCSAAAAILLEVDFPAIQYLSKYASVDQALASVLLDAEHQRGPCNRAKSIHPQTASKSVLHHYTLQLHPQQTAPSVPQSYILQLHTNSLLLLACYHYKDLLLYCILQCRGMPIEISSVDLVASDFRCHDEWDQMISFWVCNTRRSWFFDAKKEELFVSWELKKFDYYDQISWASFASLATFASSAIADDTTTPEEWERPKPGRRPDIFPQFSPMKTPLPPPLPADPPEEDEEEEEEKKEEPEEDPDKEETDEPKQQ